MEVNGKFYSAELTDRLYNTYRLRIPVSLKAVRQLLTISTDLNGNVRSDTTHFTFLPASSERLSQLQSIDGICTLEFPSGYDFEVGIGTGTLPLKNNEKNAVAYMVQPFDAVLPVDSRLLFPGPAAEDWGDVLNSTAVHRLTEGEWVPLETHYDTEMNVIYSPLEKPGIYRLLKNSTLQPILPDKTTLSPNYPNPFNAATTVRFTLAEAGRVKMVIYNILGEQVKVLNSGFMEPGTYSSIWTGLTDTGRSAGSGLYIIVLSSGSTRISQKMLLMK